jgi:hypothetical protein
MALETTRGCKEKRAGRNRPPSSGSAALQPVGVFRAQDRSGELMASQTRN